MILNKVLHNLFLKIVYFLTGLRNDFMHFLVCSGIVALFTNVAVSFGKCYLQYTENEQSV